MKENKNLYVILIEIDREGDGGTSDIIGVYDTKEEAKKVALSEISDRYAYDLEDSYDNDKESLEFKETSYGWEYHSNYDFYNVEVCVLTKPLNVRDIEAKAL